MAVLQANLTDRRILHRRDHALGAQPDNPWLTPPASPSEPPARPVEVSVDAPAPQPGVLPPPPEQRLPLRELSRQELLVPLWLTAAHGGAGCSTLVELSVGWKEAGRAWPLSPQPDRPARVLLCARTSYTGLRAAQAALTDWASGRVPVKLEGLMLAAAAPGRLPRQLRPLLELVKGAAGRVWEVGWQSQWLIAPPVMTADRGLRELFDELNIQRREA
jgi:hypothetical protein